MSALFSERNDWSGVPGDAQQSDSALIRAMAGRVVDRIYLDAPDRPLFSVGADQIREVTRIDEFDRVRARLGASSGELYTSPDSDQSGLLKDELRGFASFPVGSDQSGNGIVPGGNGGGDLGDAGTQLLAALDVDNQLPDLGHVAPLGDDDLNGHVDGQFDQALVEGQFGDKGSLGVFVHGMLQGFSARIKAIFGRGAQ